MLKRSLQSKIQAALEAMPVAALLGLKQSGKKNSFSCRS